MDPNGFEYVQKLRKTCEIFETTSENFEKLRANVYENFFHNTVDSKFLIAQVVVINVVAIIRGRAVRSLWMLGC